LATIRADRAAKVGRNQTPVTKVGRVVVDAWAECVVDQRLTTSCLSILAGVLARKTAVRQQGDLSASNALKKEPPSDEKRKTPPLLTKEKHAR